MSTVIKKQAQPKASNKTLEKSSTKSKNKKPEMEKLNNNSKENKEYLKLLEKYKSYSPQYNRPRTSKTPTSNKARGIQQKNEMTAKMKGKSTTIPKTVNSSKILALTKAKVKRTTSPSNTKIKKINSAGIGQNDKKLSKNLMKTFREGNISPFNKKNTSNKTNQNKEKAEKNKTLTVSKSQNNITKKLPEENETIKKKSQKVEEIKEQKIENNILIQQEENKDNNENKANTLRNVKPENKLVLNKEKETNEENPSAKKKMAKSSSVPNLVPKKKVIKKVKKIESLSQVGFSGLGIPKHNQDSFFVYKNLNDEENVLYIGVCDGHGYEGHDVSKYLINNLPKNLNDELKKSKKYIRDKENLEKILKEVFISTNNSLYRVKSFDTDLSGSTCVTIILTKNKIISANAGDSRAVLGRCVDNKWEAIDLSRDHKPSDEDEYKRIIAAGGHIEAYKDENGADFGPKRVWVKGAEYPGLAMSRSFGDGIAHSVGTISEPEIKYFDLTPEDKFVIIASDGIWEFISSQECVNIIKDYYYKNDITSCLKYLLMESSKRWIKEEEVIDDITAVIVFFED